MAASRKHSSRPPQGPPVPRAEKDTLRLSREMRGVQAPEPVGVAEEMRAMRDEIRQLREEVEALRVLVVRGRVSGAYSRRTEE
jgi:hypothetical protein